jgi:hypothetical protein
MSLPSNKPQTDCRKPATACFLTCYKGIKNSVQSEA